MNAENKFILTYNFFCIVVIQFTNHKINIPKNIENYAEFFLNEIKKKSCKQNKNI
jgi:hypothetical protein